MTKASVSVVVTDMDNTLYDWFAMWHAAFDAMLERLAADSGVPRERLEREFHAIHQKHGTVEYAFAIQELPSLRDQHPEGELPHRYAAAIEAYREARRRTLQLYPGVMETLQTVKAQGALVVAYTESLAFYANYRVRALGLDGVLDYLYSPADHDMPRGLSPAEIRRYPAEHYQLAATVHRHTPPRMWKPAATVLLDLLADVGAEPRQALYVGDSLAKDVTMAQAAGVLDLFARYGDARRRPGYDLLRRVTSWSPAMLEHSERLDEARVRPTHVLADGLADLLTIVELAPFARPAGVRGAR